MAQFFYKAVDSQGRDINGSIDATDRRSAVAALADNGHFVTELAEGTLEHNAAQQPGLSLAKIIPFAPGRIRGKEVLTMTSHLATALHAGLPLFNALEIIRQGHKPGPLRELLGELSEAVSAGKSLSEAMEEHRDVFSQLYISMVRVGETGGILEQTLSELSKLMEREEKIRSRMITAATYPAIVLIIGLLSAFVVVTWIMPAILDAIAGGMVVLPLPTRMLLALSEFIKQFGWLVFIIIAAAAYWFMRFRNTAQGRLKIDSWKLRMPIVGSVLRSIAVGRFARTLGALTKCGITIIEALNVVRDTLGNEVLAKKIDTVTEEIRTGHSLAEPLGKVGDFPPLLVQIVSIGEETGKLDELLLNAADTFDSQADEAIERFMQIFPVLLILFLGAVIGFIIAATLLPILTMGLGI